MESPSYETFDGPRDKGLIPDDDFPPRVKEYNASERYPNVLGPTDHLPNTLGPTDHLPNTLDSTDLNPRPRPERA